MFWIVSSIFFHPDRLSVPQSIDPTAKTLITSSEKIERAGQVKNDIYQLANTALQDQFLKECLSKLNGKLWSGQMPEVGFVIGISVEPIQLL